MKKFKGSKNPGPLCLGLNSNLYSDVSTRIVPFIIQISQTMPPSVLGDFNVQTMPPEETRQWANRLDLYIDQGLRTILNFVKEQYKNELQFAKFNTQTQGFMTTIYRFATSSKNVVELKYSTIAKVLTSKNWIDNTSFPTLSHDCTVFSCGCPKFFPLQQFHQNQQRSNHFPTYFTHNFSAGSFTTSIVQVVQRILHTTVAQDHLPQA